MRPLSVKVRLRSSTVILVRFNLRSEMRSLTTNNFKNISILPNDPKIDCFYLTASLEENLRSKDTLFFIFIYSFPLTLNLYSSLRNHRKIASLLKKARSILDDKSSLNTREFNMQRQQFDMTAKKRVPKP